MIYQIIDLPPNTIGFKASWKVTKQDFDEVVIPCLKRHVEKTGQLNYLLILNTTISNSSFDIWFNEMMLGIKHIFKLKRFAIVSDSRSIKGFTKMLSLFLPGEFKTFTHEEMEPALNWLSGSSE